MSEPLTSAIRRSFFSAPLNIGSEAVEYASGSFDKDQNVYVGAAHLNSGGKTHGVGICILRYII